MGLNIKEENWHDVDVIYVFSLPPPYVNLHLNMFIKMYSVYLLSHITIYVLHITIG